MFNLHKIWNADSFPFVYCGLSSGAFVIIVAYEDEARQQKSKKKNRSKRKEKMKLTYT